MPARFPEVRTVAPPKRPVARTDVAETRVPLPTTDRATRPPPRTPPLESEPVVRTDVADTREADRTPETATRPVPVATPPTVDPAAALVDPTTPNTEPTDFAAALLPAPIIDAAEVTGAV